MSKRAGNFVTLADVVREVGKDVVRFTMLTRKPEAQMDFDFAKVVEASKDNPVFYVQYAHARVCSTLRKAAAEGAWSFQRPTCPCLATEELALVKLAAQFPRMVEAGAAAREPHRIAFFLHDLGAAFHGYWNLMATMEAVRLSVRIELQHPAGHGERRSVLPAPCRDPAGQHFVRQAQGGGRELHGRQLTRGFRPNSIPSRRRASRSGEGLKCDNIFGQNVGIDLS
jgi:hypothetical protein